TTMTNNNALTTEQLPSSTMMTMESGNLDQEKSKGTNQNLILYIVIPIGIFLLLLFFLVILFIMIRKKSKNKKGAKGEHQKDNQSNSEIFMNVLPSNQSQHSKASITNVTMLKD